MERKEIAWISFTERGASLARELSAVLGGVCSAAFGENAVTLNEWTRENFSVRGTLIYVGAVGIAVRAVAPLLKSKATDPAVIAVDEAGRFVIPVVSGHLGGANEMARRIADCCGGTAVITTATDLRGLFAADLWARRQGLRVLDAKRIKSVSGKLLAGGQIGIWSRWPIHGTPPESVLFSAREDADVIVDVHAGRANALCLVPVSCTLGVGCRRGISSETIEVTFQRFCKERGVLPESIVGAASIDVKRDEQGLLDFCRAHGWDLLFLSAEALSQTEGTFTSSSFVASAVGVDNVCERASVTASGGELIERKFASAGVTFALAGALTALDWSC